MKIKKSEFKKIIQEEIRRMLSEQPSASEISRNPAAGRYYGGTGPTPLMPGQARLHPSDVRTQMLRQPTLPAPTPGVGTQIIGGAAVPTPATATTAMPRPVTMATQAAQAPIRPLTMATQAAQTPIRPPTSPTRVARPPALGDFRGMQGGRGAAGAAANVGRMGRVAAGAGRFARASIPWIAGELALRGGYAAGQAGLERLAPEYADAELGGLGWAAEGDEYQTSGFEGGVDTGGRAQADAPSLRRQAGGAGAAGQRDEQGNLIRDLSAADREAYYARQGGGAVASVPVAVEEPVAGVPVAVEEPVAGTEEGSRRSRRRSRSPEPEPAAVEAPGVSVPTPVPIVAPQATMGKGVGAMGKGVGAMGKGVGAMGKQPAQRASVPEAPWGWLGTDEEYARSSQNPANRPPERERGRMYEVPLNETIEREINRILNGVLLK